MHIYLTDLQAYNEGNLVGKWIQLPLTEFELSQAISEVLTEGETICDSEDHEEIFITDYESDYSIEEYDNVYKLNELAEAISEFSEYDLLKFRYLVYESINQDEILKNGLDTYDVDIYDYSNNTSFTDTFELLAQDFINEGMFGEIPKSLEYYIDYSAIARDLRMDYCEFEPNVVARLA